MSTEQSYANEMKANWNCLHISHWIHVLTIQLLFQWKIIADEGKRVPSQVILIEVSC